MVLLGAVTALLFTFLDASLLIMPKKSPSEPGQTVPWLMSKDLGELEVFLNWVTGKDFMSMTELCMWLNCSCCPNRSMGETRAKHLKQAPNPNCR